MEIKPLDSWLFWIGATTNFKAYPCKTTSPSEVISKLHEWIDTQMNPKAICADMAFHHPHDMRAFYQMHNVKSFPTGTHTVDVKFSVCVTRSWRRNEETHNQEPTKRCIILLCQDRYWHHWSVRWANTRIAPWTSDRHLAQRYCKWNWKRLGLEFRGPWAKWIKQVVTSVKTKMHYLSHKQGKGDGICHIIKSSARNGEM